MLTPSLIYIAVTILLAWTDAIRIKVRWNKVKNIDHGLSRILAFTTGGLLTVLFVYKIAPSWLLLVYVLLLMVAFIAIRLALYDPLLNIFRAWTGTNPTWNIGYVSTETSSYEDQHSEMVGFLWKRIIGMAGFFAMYFLYRIIFKV